MISTTLKNISENYKDKNIILFGASKLGITLLSKLKKINVKVDYFSDDDMNKQNTYINGVYVIKPIDNLKMALL